jgi:hypothetical protein
VAPYVSWRRPAETGVGKSSRTSSGASKAALLNGNLDHFQVGELPESKVDHPLQGLHESRLKHGEAVVTRVVHCAFALEEPPSEPVFSPKGKTVLDGLVEGVS